MEKNKKLSEREQYKEIIEALKSDENYYGKFGQKFLSNSNISVLLSNPLELHSEQEYNINFLIGGYFHTAVLEPEKLVNYKIIDAATRNNKRYKEESENKMCLLKKEADRVMLMKEALDKNKYCSSLIKGFDVVYEMPGVKNIGGNMWKGKADIINHSEGLVIDLKTTSNLDSFQYNSHKYNYDSQAYIYKEIFDYDMLFMVIDKNTHQIGLFDCSEPFYLKGSAKVQKANDVYNLFYKTEGFDPEQFFISKTL